MRTNLSKKFARCELERDVWLLKGVNRDHVILGMGGCHKCAPILSVHMQMWFVHTEVFPPDIDDLGINLDAIYRDRPVDLCKLMGDGARRQPNNANAVQLLRLKAAVKVRGREEVIPVPACQNPVRVGIVDRMDGLSLIE